MPKLRKTTENDFILCHNFDNVQKLRHENFVTYFFFFFFFFFFIKISLEKVSWFNQILFRNTQRKKIAKTRLWLWVHISWTLTVKGSKLCVILRIDLNNFGILNSFHSEMFKVRKSSENDFNWKVNISRSTRVKASKFYVIRRLDLNSFFPKFGILTSFHS